MTAGGKKECGQSDGMKEKIRLYMSSLDPELLSVDKAKQLEILEVAHGAYNLNYHLRIGGKDFIFRINIEQQSGLGNQIQYEFNALRFLEGHHIAPRAYHVDSTCERFNHGILIEEFIEGTQPSLEAQEMPAVADLLVRLHSLGGGEEWFVIWKDPLVDTFELVLRDYLEYETRRTADKRLLGLGRELLSRLEPLVYKYRHLYSADAVNHTDVSPDNLIVTSAGLRLIDWEKPRIDDGSYDICCFLSEPAQMWGSSQEVLSRDGREAFLSAYIARCGKGEDLVRKKFAYRYPLVSLHWTLWGALQLCDLQEERTAAELQEAHETKIGRYLKIADPDNIERLLDASVPMT